MLLFVHKATVYQFGFKKEHSTDIYMYALKEMIDTLQYLLPFLDASKSNDKIDHCELFIKLFQNFVKFLIILAVGS